MHTTGRYVRALYARGGGPHCANIRTENSSSKLNLNLSVLPSERCFRMEHTFVRTLFQNDCPSTLVDMLKHSVRLHVPEHCFKLNT